MFKRKRKEAERKSNGEEQPCIEHIPGETAVEMKDLGNQQGKSNGEEQPCIGPFPGKTVPELNGAQSKKKKTKTCLGFEFGDEEDEYDRRCCSRFGKFMGFQFDTFEKTKFGNFVSQYMFMLLSSALAVADIITDILTALDHFGITRNSDSKPDYIWGSLTIIIVLIPGLICFIYELFHKKAEEDEEGEVSDSGNRKHVQRLIAYLMFPITVAMYPFYVMYKTRWRKLDIDDQGDTFKRYLKKLTDLTIVETFGEAVMQLILQIFIGFTKNELNDTQKVGMTLSFLAISKTVIWYDISELRDQTIAKCLIAENDMYSIQRLTYVEKFKYTLSTIPIYVSSLFFRCVTISLMCAYLRYYSIIPLAIYLFLLYLPIACGVLMASRWNKVILFLTNIVVMSIGENDVIDNRTSLTFTLVTAAISFFYLSTCLGLLMMMEIYLPFYIDYIDLPDTMIPHEIEKWQCNYTTGDPISFTFMNSTFSNMFIDSIKDSDIDCKQIGVFSSSNIFFCGYVLILVGLGNLILATSTRWAAFKIAALYKHPKKLPPKIYLL